MLWSGRDLWISRFSVFYNSVSLSRNFRGLSRTCSTWWINKMQMRQAKSYWHNQVRECLKKTMYIRQPHLQLSTKWMRTTTAKFPRKNLWRWYLFISSQFPVEKKPLNSGLYGSEKNLHHVNSKDNWCLRGWLTSSLGVRWKHCFPTSLIVLSYHITEKVQLLHSHLIVFIKRSSGDDLLYRDKFLLRFIQNFSRDRYIFKSILK